MRSGHRWAVRFVACAVAGAVAAGCSSGAAPADTSGLPHVDDLKALVTAVSERQHTDQTAKLSLRGELTGAASALKFTGEGVLQVLADSTSLKFTQVVTQPGAAPQETGFIVLPDAIYLRQPAIGNVQQPWTKVDPTSSDPEAQRLVAQSRSLTESADPARTLARYGDATRIVDAADDVIDGDPAVRYTIVVDVAKAAAAEPDPRRKAQLQQQVDGGLAQLTVTLWIDRAGRPVRSWVRQPLPGIGTLSITGSYRDWGQPVEIEAPPKSQVR